MKIFELWLGLYLFGMYILFTIEGVVKDKPYYNILAFIVLIISSFLIAKELKNG